MSTPELQQGTVIAGRYRLEEYKGSGSFGEVWKAEDTELGLDVAIKLYISLDQNGQSEFKEEYKVAYGLSHENLLTAQYYGVWEHRPYLIMKYCENGSAASLAGNADEAAIWRFLHDVSAGLRYLHGLEPPVVHQDIKPENILRDEQGRFLITDFGISRKMRNTMRKQSQRVHSSGAIPYMGPERFTADPVTVNASDVWSLGVSAFELATGDLPFMGQGGAMLSAGAELPNIDLSKYSKDLNDVIRACMSKETWDRPTAEQLEKYTAARLGGDTTPWKPEAAEVQDVVAPDDTADDQSTVRDDGTGRATIPAGEAAKHCTPSARQVAGGGKKSRRGIYITISASIIVIAIAAVAALYFLPGSKSKAAKQDEETVQAVELYDKLSASALRDIDAATNDNYEPLLSAARKIDSIGMLIDDNDFLADSVPALTALIVRYSEKSEPAIDAWLRAARTQYEVAEDLPAAIEYYGIAASLHPHVPGCVEDISAADNSAYEAVASLAEASHCPAAYMAVTKCRLSDDGRAVEVEYSGLTDSAINGVGIHYVLYDRLTGDTSEPLGEGDATITIEPGEGRKLAIDIPEGTGASAISLSSGGVVFYHTK